MLISEKEFRCHQNRLILYLKSNWGANEFDRHRYTISSPYFLFLIVHGYFSFGHYERSEAISDANNAKACVIPVVLTGAIGGGSRSILRNGRYGNLVPNGELEMMPF